MMIMIRDLLPVPVIDCHYCIYFCLRKIVNSLSTVTAFNDDDNKASINDVVVIVVAS